MVGWLVLMPIKPKHSLHLVKQMKLFTQPFFSMMYLFARFQLTNILGFSFRSVWIQGIAWARMNLLRSLKFTLDRKSLQQIYFTFVRPVLEYADVVWGNCTEQQSELLEKIQREAGRIVTGTTKFVGI